jgi:hypothetical protein
MAKGGKSGGSKGGGSGGSVGGGKGGGGKGKKGGGCSAGDIVNIGLDSALVQTVKEAFDNAVKIAGGTDMIVRLECGVAQMLVFAIATNMQTNFSRKKPKGKKAG